MKFNYDLFLCHTGANKDWVRELARSIEDELTDGKHLKVFFDEWDIEPGSNIVLELDKALAKSRYVGVVLSPEMLKAEWPHMEWTIAVSKDPSGRKGQVIPIWLGDCEIPGPLRIRNVLYFRDEAEYKKSYPRLISLLKTESSSRRKSSETIISENQNSQNFSLQYHDDVDEQLASNLFPVTRIPKYIWHGPIGSLTPKDVFEHLKKKVKGVHPTYLIKEKRIYSFWELSHYKCPFKELLTASDIQQETIAPWIDNDTKRKWIIELFNMALRRHCWDLNLRYDVKHGRFFFLPLGGIDRPITWHTGKRNATRHVTAKHTMGKNNQVFWSHQALRAKFMFVGDEIFLQLDPGWTFTFDGEHQLTGKHVGPFSTKWTAKEYNSSVFYHVRFWSNLLSKKSNSISIYLGNEKLAVDATPAVIDLHVGIDGDFSPIDKVFETADKEIESIELQRTELLNREIQS